MKKVILFRHAMATNYSKHIVDHDRILTPEGIQNAKRMGKYLKKKDTLPEYVISSSALRAKKTAELAIKSGGWNCKSKINKHIYGGSPKYLMNLLNKQSDDIEFICLVGHEPNFSNFICMSTDNIYRILPTASMAKIHFNVNYWSELCFNLGELEWMIFPEDL